MREIKFRFFDTQHKMMLNDLDVADLTINQSLKDDDDWKIMQFTGLKDRNGIEIYEGDILHFINCFMDVNENVEVIFENAMFKFVTKTEKFVFGRSENYSLEVIGNIYENKELLQKMKDV